MPNPKDVSLLFRLGRRVVFGQPGPVPTRPAGPTQRRPDPLGPFDIPRPAPPPARVLRYDPFDLGDPHLEPVAPPPPRRPAPGLFGRDAAHWLTAQARDDVSFEAQLRLRAGDDLGFSQLARGGRREHLRWQLAQGPLFSNTSVNRMLRGGAESGGGGGDDPDGEPRRPPPPRRRPSSAGPAMAAAGGPNAPPPDPPPPPPPPPPPDPPPPQDPPPPPPPDPKKLAAAIAAKVGADVKTHPLRQAYEAEVAGLKQKGEAMLAAGQAEEAVARALNKERREIGERYKDVTPEPLREYIYELNLGRYQDKLGPDYDRLKDLGKSDSEIIASAARPNPDINKFLGKFEEWLAGQPVAKLLNWAGEG